MDQKLKSLQAGDIIARKDDSGQWQTVKVLDLEETLTHAKLYEQIPQKPLPESLKNKKIVAHHTTISRASMTDDWELIGHAPLKETDLSAYFEYLKKNCFERYIRISGKSADKIKKKAEKLFFRARSYSIKGKAKKALLFFDRTIDLYPLHDQAWTYRSLLYVEMGQFKTALEGLNQSLQLNPKNFTAFFAKGECLMKLSRSREAIDWFQEGLSRFPEQKTLLTEFRSLASSKKNQ